LSPIWLSVGVSSLHSLLAFIKSASYAFYIMRFSLLLARQGVKKLLLYVH
jgi:hypothetical protein